jgi:ribosomal protein L3 glutamine methyltransferase
VLESDLFGALEGNLYDLIVSNPPYVSREELDSLPEEYRREPELGLLGGEDGLEVVIRILRQAGAHLSDDGILIIELGATAPRLEQRFPEVPWTWLEFERGGEGVLLLTREQLGLHQWRFEEG